MSALKKAVFLDRDGVLCEDTDYITSFEKLHIYPFAKKEQIGVSIAGLTSYRHKSKKYMVLQNCVPDSYRPQLFCLHNS